MQCSLERVLFDHLIGAGEQHKWNSETERLSGFWIESYLKSRNLLHRQIARLLAALNAVGVAAHKVVTVTIAGTIAREPARYYVSRNG